MLPNANLVPNYDLRTRVLAWQVQFVPLRCWHRAIDIRSGAAQQAPASKVTRHTETTAPTVDLRHNVTSLHRFRRGDGAGSGHTQNTHAAVFIECDGDTCWLARKA